MPAQITMWCYLWDLVDDGIDDVLREMKDEIGLTALSVATHYHTVEHYRPHTKGRFIYRDESALYFQPDWKLYRGSRIRHRISPLAEAGNPLARVAERAAAIGLDLLSWTLACHSSYLGRTYPECSLESATGDRYPEALCPANPDVRGFLAGLADDLTRNYGVKLVELESCEYQAARHFHHHEKIAMTLGPADHFLQALCFCEHCRARGGAAGAGVSELRLIVDGLIRDSFARGEPKKETVPELIERVPGLAAYVTVRIGAVGSLIAEIRSASAAPISPIVWADSAVSGLDAADSARETGSVTITAYTADPGGARRMIRTAADQTNGVEKLRVGYHTYPPVAPDRETLLRVIDASIDEGVRAFSFYNYGIAPRRSLDWVSDAAALIRKHTG